MQTQTTINKSEKFTKEKLQSLILAETTIKDMLASQKVTPQVFASKVISTVFDDEKNLKDCTPESIMRCIIKSAQFGLPVDAHGFAWLVPRKNNKLNILEANFQIGYRGYINLAKRNPDVLSISCEVVYKDDFFEVLRGSEEKIVHKPNYDIIRKDGDIRLAYAIIKYKNGGEEWDVMPKEEIEKARKTNFGTDKEGSAWSVWYNEMAKKTVVRRLLKKCYFMEVEEAISADDDEQFKDITPKSSINIDSLVDSYKPQGQTQTVIENKNQSPTEQTNQISQKPLICVKVDINDKEKQERIKANGFKWNSNNKSWCIESLETTIVKNKLIAIGINEQDIAIF